MNFIRSLTVAGLTFTAILSTALAQSAQAPRVYTGFDQNLYPGDAMLPLLKKNLDFLGYWLNTPPGSNINTWEGKRGILRDQGFGFLVLFNSRTGKALKHLDAPAAGRADAALAIAAAKREGFPSRAILFLILKMEAAWSMP